MSERERHHTGKVDPAKILRLTYHGAVLSKKNSKRIIKNRRTGAPVIASNPAAKANENDMVTQFSLHAARLEGPIVCCAVDIKIFEPNLQRRDIDNQATSILDALVKAGMLVDDSFKCVRELGIRFAGIDRKNPRAEIVITEQASVVQ